MPHGEGQPESSLVDRMVVQLQGEMQRVGSLTIVVKADAESFQHPFQDESERL
jgi:hypothetical protein